ncbi:N-acetyltransferase family protein [Bradyrhizobium sp.]|jgi:GNAT superfamily N-acetyltransferase|uniref:GNAT family N-acetyltransferase n=1 Tax=Bradyrhizobium sp. TaxID=376 RepID=UPI003C22DEA5
MAVAVRAARLADREAWQPLWQSYLIFYKASVAADVTEATWQRFFDPLEGLGAFVAERDGQLIGFAHYLLHRSTWAPKCYCYLEDLFVEPAARGGGTGRALIAAVEATARAAGANRLYWVTDESNHPAQKLYDQVAERPSVVQYRKML